MMPLFYYSLSSFLISTLIFMMNEIPLFTISWAVCIVLSTLVMLMLDKVFLEDIDEDTW